MKKGRHCRGFSLNFAKFFRNLSHTTSVVNSSFYTCSVQILQMVLSLTLSETVNFFDTGAVTHHKFGDLFIFSEKKRMESEK